MKTHRIVAVLLLLPALLAFPLTAFALFGLAGADAENVALMCVGYFVYLVSAALGIWKKTFLLGCLAGALLFSCAGYADYLFWKTYNRTFCADMRADLYCIEGATGFQCVEPSPLGNMVVGASICEEKLTEDQREQSNKKKRAAQIEQARKEGRPPIKKIADSTVTMNALGNFEAIAETVISSSRPENLDFEKDLISISQCLQEEYEDPMEGEIMASNVLARLIKTDEEKERYARYSAAHGRYLNSRRFVAGLPNGPKTLGCKTLPADGLSTTR